MRFVGFLAQVALTVGSAAAALIPLWVYVLAQHLLKPQGFWQNFVLFGVGVYILGALQLVLFIVWLVFVFSLWLSPSTPRLVRRS